MLGGKRSVGCGLQLVLFNFCSRNVMNGIDVFNPFVVIETDLEVGGFFCTKWKLSCEQKKSQTMCLPFLKF